MKSLPLDIVSIIRDWVKSYIAPIDRVTEITLTASGWIGSSVPYEQTVSVPGQHRSEATIMVVSALDDNASETEQKAYMKAYGIIISGTAELNGEIATFKVYKKPISDVTIGLKGV